MALMRTGSQITKTLRNASRLRSIVGVFARHGFRQVLEKAQLEKFVPDRFYSSADLDHLTWPERIRSAFEELGPTFVKLGQLLAARPDLVPEDYVQEFEKLHDRVLPLPFDVIEKVLIEELGVDYKKQIQFVNPEPLGSASIAQVHKATLVSGESVVVKVQRPGILSVINEDLNVLYYIAELLEKSVPESALYNPVGIVNEYFKTLELETNFVVEANNIRRFKENFAAEKRMQIPKVYFELTTEKVLVLEALEGKPLSQFTQPELAQINATEVLRLGLSQYLKMVFEFGLFHGDLHAGNFFILPENRIGLVDFGVVGRLNSKTQAAIANMLLALAKEDYERLAFEYIDLAPFTDQVKADQFAKELQELIAPYYGLTLRNVNLGKLLLKSSGIAAQHHLQMPTDLMLFFKSLVAIEGMGRKIQSDFDFLSYSLEFASEIAKTQLGPTRVAHDIGTWARESRSLLNSLPRQLNFFLRKVNSPEYAFKIKSDEIASVGLSVEKSFSLLFLGILLSTVLLCSTLIYVFKEPSTDAAIFKSSMAGFGVAGLIFVYSYLKYLRKK